MATQIYALDAFEASQEGQLSMSKNDELYLLNDEHYYWWYVQHAASAAMGFVPAELLELPNERLARQNSLRNQSVESVSEIVKKRPSQRSVRFREGDQGASGGAKECDTAPGVPELSDDSLVDTSMSSPPSPDSISDVLPRPAPPPASYDKVPGMAHNIERLEDLQARLQQLMGGLNSIY